jgi:ABC-type antimicrobial peptide transport system permease subunit
LGEFDRQTVQIVGAVEDAAFVSVRDAIPPTIYRPLAQVLNEQSLPQLPSISISIRTVAGFPPDRLSAAVDEAIHRVDPNVSVTFRALSAYLDAYYVRERLLAVLSGFFGTLALLLAGVGLYSVTAYSVAHHSPELAIRAALGAAPAGLVRLMLQRVAVLVGSGTAIGLLLSWWSASFARALLYGVDAQDPKAIAGAVITVTAVGIMASWFPARRATRFNPADILRQ